MEELTENIHIQYLKEEIIKMQKTSKCLQEMIAKKDPEKDDELIQILDRIHSTTMDTIKNKEKKLKQLYDRAVETDNN